MSSQALVISVIQYGSQSVGSDSRLHARSAQGQLGQRARASSGRGYTEQCGAWEGTDRNLGV